jgi:peptidyl-prolyl cis-trans isomerase SurA
MFGAIVSKAQQKNDQVLLTIGDEKIPASEFVRIYLKNNQTTSITDSKVVEDYLNLFVNFKLKVYDALNAKLDTSTSFKNELAGYRLQLARPYMVDQETEQRLIDEAYERMKYDVSASHILISVPEKATPSDTIKLFEKAISIRNRIINGEPFEVVARATSDDHSVNSNNGILGYFTAFQMVYPFESATYKLKIGEVSMPVRSRFGYHIIKLLDKRPAKGQVKVAHIMIAVSKDANPEQQAQAKDKIQNIYKLVLNNEDFGKLANQFSQDPGSSKNNGELPWFGTGNLVAEFEKVAFSFDHDGQVSEPFQTAFGWHIVKRIGRKEIGTFEEMLPDIKRKLSSDIRNSISIEKMVGKIKIENNFKEDTLNLLPIVSLVDSSIYKGAWKQPILKVNKVLFTLADQKHDQSEFVNYLLKYQQNKISGDFHSIVKRAYNDWVKLLVYHYQESILDQKYPDFRNLMQEYHDGILLFNISDINVWSKASNDSVGLSKFYQDKKDNYRWGERVHYAIYSCADEKQLAKAIKMVASRKTKGLKPEDILTKLNKGKQPLVNLNYKVSNPDDKDVADYKLWVNSTSTVSNSEEISRFREIIEVTTGDIKDLSDCKGQAISDYQLALEDEWLKSLHQKYTVVINQDVFKEVVNSLLKK